MECLAVYDICDPRRLRRVARLMERYGVRVQKSVFECCLVDSTLREMLDRARLLLDDSVDSIRVYPLLAGAREKQWIAGAGAVLAFPDVCVT